MVDPAPQVFINSGATELPFDFITHLVWGLADLGILDVFIDRDEWWGRDLDHVFSCIEESTIALAIFSPCYPETEWCLDELVKMKEQANKNKLLVIPVFYNVSKNDVRDLEGEFGGRFMEMRQKYTGYKYDPFRFQRWETSLTSISRMEPSLTWEAQSSNISLAEDIIREIKRELDMASDPGLSFPSVFSNDSHSKMEIREVKRELDTSSGSHSKMAIKEVKRELDMASDPEFSFPSDSSNDSDLKMTVGEVFFSAFLAAFLFSLFVARFVFTDVRFFRTAKWLVGFPVVIVVLHQLHCALTQQYRRLFT